MFMEERQKEIADKIKKDGKITIAEITEKYNLSDESARRDLRLLEQKGLCKRTHGGAIDLKQVGITPPKDRNFESMTIYPNYREIAKQATKSICQNDIIYITGGSFGYIMLSMLPKDIKFTVVVNSIDIGKALREFDNIDVYVVGGKMRQSGSIVDSLATKFISNFHFDKCFITGAGLTADFGLSNGTDETCTFQRAVIKNSRKKILLMPNQKIGVDSFVKVCEADEFDCLITDWDCADDQLDELRERIANIITVEESK